MVRRKNAPLVLLAGALLAASSVSAVGIGTAGVDAVASQPDSPSVDGVAADEATTTNATATTTNATATNMTTTTTTASGTTPPRELETVVVARYPAANGSMVEERVFDASSVASAAPPTYDSRSDRWHVPVTLTEAGASAFASALVDAGFTSDGVADCPTTDARNDRGHCLLLVVDGEVTTAFAIGERFAAAVESGAFESDPSFVLATSNETEAKQVWRGLLDDSTPPSTTSTTGPATTGSSVGGTTTAGPSTTRTASNGATTTGRTTTAVTTTGATTETETPSVDDEGDESGPASGFGVAVAVAALLAVGLALCRR